MSVHLPPRLSRPSSRKHNESLRDYVKHFCNTRNGILYIQDIEIINAFCDGISDLKTVEETVMKKPKTVVDLLTVADVCIEAFEARAWLLESRGKGPSRKRDNWEVSDRDEHMAEINMIFRGSMSITSKTQGKKLQREINLAQQIEPWRQMRWSDERITFGPEDHPVTELSERNLLLVVKISIGRHKMAKTLIDSGASLNLIMRKTFIEMGLNLSDLTPYMTRSTGLSQDRCLHP
jgi:hypothetical protein